MLQTTKSIDVNIRAKKKQPHKGAEKDGRNIDGNKIIGKNIKNLSIVANLPKSKKSNLAIYKKPNFAKTSFWTLVVGQHRRDATVTSRTMEKEPRCKGD